MTKIYIRRINNYKNTKQLTLPRALHEHIGKIAKIEFDEKEKKLEISFPIG